MLSKSKQIVSEIEKVMPSTYLIECKDKTEAVCLFLSDLSSEMRDKLLSIEVSPSEGDDRAIIFTRFLENKSIYDLLDGYHTEVICEILRGCGVPVPAKIPKRFCLAWIQEKYKASDKDLLNAVHTTGNYVGLFVSKLPASVYIYEINKYYRQGLNPDQIISMLEGIEWQEVYSVLKGLGYPILDIPFFHTATHVKVCKYLATINMVVNHDRLSVFDVYISQDNYMRLSRLSKLDNNRCYVPLDRGLFIAMLFDMAQHNMTLGSICEKNLLRMNEVCVGLSKWLGVELDPSYCSGLTFDLLRACYEEYPISRATAIRVSHGIPVGKIIEISKCVRDNTTMLRMCSMFPCNSGGSLSNVFSEVTYE